MIFSHSFCHFSLKLIKTCNIICSHLGTENIIPSLMYCKYCSFSFDLIISSLLYMFAFNKNGQNVAFINIDYRSIDHSGNVTKLVMSSAQDKRRLNSNEIKKVSSCYKERVENRQIINLARAWLMLLFGWHFVGLFKYKLTSTTHLLCSYKGQKWSFR
jgi:hypothetical protein